MKKMYMVLSFALLVAGLAHAGLKKFYDETGKAATVTLVDQQGKTQTANLPATIKYGGVNAVSITFKDANNNVLFTTSDNGIVNSNKTFTLQKNNKNVYNVKATTKD